MSSANDNQRGRRRAIRDGFLNNWGQADYSLASDDTLKKFAEARDKSSASANKYMLFAFLAAFLYVLRVLEVADDLDVGSFKLGDLPFGLFALSSAGLVLSTISLIRIGDSRSFDRQLRVLCEKRHSTGCEIEYLIYPNENAWGAPYSRMAGVASGGVIFYFFRLISLLAINLFLLGLIASPAAVSIDFIYNERFEADLVFKGLQIGLVGFFLLANLTTLMVITWLQFIDRD